MSDVIISRIWCDRVMYDVIGSVSEVEHQISYALEERSPFIYFYRAKAPDKQVCINAWKVSSIAPATPLD